ncbi:MAG: bifunctional 4-hydroxy-2-oxoglutarate aldolase/2-dehydro-3-deoxy-phosphogluconate aldolase, partial [Phaeodactylibacter sp.]|nr:bifunctional 4-hydroxy-2-oxoglutarate aldolase/2-dehydro-3-deoxy-phosphogluconate aldolase [Phaeodactylibacter sp.]
KDIKGPQPWTSVMPTGGVSPTLESLKAWFEAGVTCVGMGSKLISGDILKSGDFETLEKRTRDALGIIRELRGKG